MECGEEFDQRRGRYGGGVHRRRRLHDMVG
jgi:hypothetical protein